MRQTLLMAQLRDVAARLDGADSWCVTTLKELAILAIALLGKHSEN
ncbi:MAG: hypothetical protein MH252_04155 [Thermosynechococcaceae cyanobacterium MS004]|nr:hypothetical protein [Thermosynechococcaceae cyanobacterium MS004]